ncbi:MAG: sensor histidine kinase [Lachnospira sp.]
MDFNINYYFGTIITGILVAVLLGGILKLLFRIKKEHLLNPGEITMAVCGIICCVIGVFVLNLYYKQDRLYDIISIILTIYAILLTKEIVFGLEIPKKAKNVLCFFSCLIPFIMLILYFFKVLPNPSMLIIIAMYTAFAIISLKLLEIKDNETLYKLYKVGVYGRNKQIEELVNAENELKKIKHDINAHLQVLKGIICADYNTYDELKECHNRLQSYLNSSIGELGNYLDEISTGNEILDIVLRTRKKECKNRGIELFPTILGEIKNQIDDVDFVSLLVNLLDNAIEANEKISDNNIYKYIELAIDLTQDKTVIRVTNTALVSSDTHFRNDWSTDKEDKANHGYGTKIIKDIVNKYDGTIEYEIEDGLVECMVRI